MEIEGPTYPRNPRKVSEHGRSPSGVAGPVSAFRCQLVRPWRRWETIPILWPRAAVVLLLSMTFGASFARERAPVFAQPVARTDTVEIVSSGRRAGDRPNEVFSSGEFRLIYTSGRVTLSGDPPGSPFGVDGTLTLDVTHPDGTIAHWDRTFNPRCAVSRPIPAEEVTRLLQIGLNVVRVTISDACDKRNGALGSILLTGVTQAASAPPPQTTSPPESESTGSPIPVVAVGIAILVVASIAATYAALRPSLSSTGGAICRRTLHQTLDGVLRLRAFAPACRSLVGSKYRARSAILGKVAALSTGRSWGAHLNPNDRQSVGVEAIEPAFEQQVDHQMWRDGRLIDPSGRGTVITAIGAKGGIGKSVIAVNLAVALRQEKTDTSVVIFDADTGLGDAATLLDVDPERTVGDLLPVIHEVDRGRIVDYIAKHAEVDLLAAPADCGVWSNCSPDVMKRVIDLLSQNYDFVVVDTRGSLDVLVRACIEVSTLVLLVTSTEISSIRDTAKTVQKLDEWQIPRERVKVLLNSGARAVNGVHTDDLRVAFDQDVYWELPFDASLSESVQFGQPVVTNGHSAAEQNLRELAQRIAGTRTSAAPAPSRGLIGRLLSRGELTWTG